MTRVILHSMLAILPTLFGCCRLPITAMVNQSNRLPHRLEVVTLISNQHEILHEIPAYGFTLTDAVLKIKSKSTLSPRPMLHSEIAPDVIETTDSRTDPIIAFLREVYDNKTNRESVEKTRESLEIALGWLSDKIEVKSVSEKLTEQVLILASSNPNLNTHLDHELEKILNQFITPDVPSAANKSVLTPSTSGSNPDSIELVRVIRRTGDEIVVPLPFLFDTAIGSVLLANGDSVSLVGTDLLTAYDIQSKESITVFDRNNSTILASFNASVKDSYTVKEIWQDAINSRGNPYDTVATVQRSLPNGRTRFFIIPLPLDGVSADSDRRKTIMDMHKLAPGDSVHVGTLELLPIVLGSKIISRRLQMAALQEEHELEQIDSYEKHERIKAFREKIQAKRQGTILGTSQRWVRSASNRLADGIDAIRDTVNLP